VIFPDKLSYDGEKCRTGKLNEFLALILMTSRELQKGKVGQFFPKLALTYWVEPEGLFHEPIDQCAVDKSVISILEIDTVFS
jgi:hypothetical protein